MSSSVSGIPVASLSESDGDVDLLSISRILVQSISACNCTTGGGGGVSGIQQEKSSFWLLGEFSGILVASLSESDSDVDLLSISTILVQSISACNCTTEGGGGVSGIQQEKSSLWLLGEFSGIPVASLSESDGDVDLLSISTILVQSISACNCTTGGGGGVSGIQQEKSSFWLLGEFSGILVASLSESDSDVDLLYCGSYSDIPVQSLFACSSRGGSRNGFTGIEKSSNWLPEEISSSLSGSLVVSLSKSYDNVGLLPGSSNSEIPVQSLSASLQGGSSNSEIPVLSLSAFNSRGGSGNGRDPGIQQEKSSVWLLEEISSSLFRIMVASLSESNGDVPGLLSGSSNSDIPVTFCMQF